MNEDLQISEAARLAGTNAPVELSQKRAHAFVSKTISKNNKKSSFRSFYIKEPLYAWGSTILAVAACLLVAFIVLKPSNGDVGQYGQQGGFMENQSNHSTMSVVDTTLTVSDSSEVTVIETIEN